MDTGQVNDILSQDKCTASLYLGAFPSDQLPSSFSFPFALVANTAPSTVSEGHWIAIFARSPRVAYCFNSLGGRPSGEIRKWLIHHFPLIYYNRGKQQRDDQITCGGYCIFVLRELAEGKSFSRVVRVFDEMKNDDEFIKSFLLYRYQCHLNF